MPTYYAVYNAHGERLHDVIYGSLEAALMAAFNDQTIYRCLVYETGQDGALPGRLHLTMRFPQRRKKGGF